MSQPDNPDAQLQLGWLSFSQGKWQDSISYFEKGLEKLPAGGTKPLNVLYALARMYEKTGDKIKAMDTYWQLLSLMKDEDPQIQKVENRIISLDNKAGE
jgi:tetratricopeptide (TPR) repeat protein